MNDEPIYYLTFRKNVKRGKIPVNKEISLEMNRIDDLLSDSRYFFDSIPVSAFIKFCQAELTLTNGEPVRLLPSFKLWAEQLFGWYVWEDEEAFVDGGFVTRPAKKRLINKQYLIVARGAAKTMYSSFLHQYFLVTSVKTLHNIAVAPTMKQGEEVLSSIRTAITRARGPLYKFLTMGSKPLLLSTKKGIENRLVGSFLEVRPMSIPKLQGLRPFFSTVDEWLTADVRADVIGALEQGASKLEDYIIVATTSEGTIRNAAGDEIKMELTKVLRGEYNASHVSIWHYKLDSLEEVGDPKFWPKANPNIGRTVSYDAYKKDVIRAEQVPSSRNDILAKRFGIPMEGYTYYFRYEETVPSSKPLDFDGLICSLGGDLSQGDDFCSFTFLFPVNYEMGVKTRNYISERTYERLNPLRRSQYDRFIKEDSLVVLPGSILDIRVVYDDLFDFIEHHEYDVRAFGYDPYNAKLFVELWTRDNGPYGVTKVIQGAKTETVPLGEIKHLVEDDVLLFDQQLFSMAMGNAVVMEDTNGNRKLLKRRYEDKIDPVAALIDAFVAYTRMREEFE